MMKKRFLTMMMVFLGLFAGVNTMWGIDFSDAKVYMASMQAQTSPATIGSGQVQLTWIDIKGRTMENSDIAVCSEGCLNTTNPVGPAATAQLIGGTLSAMDGVEVGTLELASQLYMTSFLYFKADAIGDAGSYFHEWTFTDPLITRQDTAMDKTHPESTYFKLLPDTVNNAKMSDSEKFETVYTYVATHPKSIYAVFKKYLLSNPVVTNNGTVTATEGAQTTINVSVDVEGDITQLKEGYVDFDLPSIKFYEDEYGYWTWALAETPAEVISPMKGRANVVITYTAKNDITPGTHKATFTIRMQGENPSELNISLSVEARPASTKEASVKIGNEEPVEYENLAEAVTVANGASSDVVLTLLKDIEVSSTVTLNNTMTLDLNSYTLSTSATAMIGQPVLKVDGAGQTVTLAYNKQGGIISAAPEAFNTVMGGLAVEVVNGTLVLNGGTISSENALTSYDEAAQTAAIKVDTDGTLIQNGATITATSAGPKAIGIYNDGTVEINEGKISVDAGFNTAIAVMANDGSTTTINGGSLSALANEEDGTETMVMDLTPAAISTWTNAYAVNVAAGSTVEVNGGDLYAEATNASRAYGVATLAGFGGTLTVNKKAVIRAKSPNTLYSFPVAVMAGQVTINGGKFDGHYTSQLSGDTINPAVFGVDYSNFIFKSGTCKTDEFFIENPEEAFAGSLLHPAVTLYKVTKGSKDYNDGYRNIAVADIINGNPATQADRIAAGVPAARIGTTGYTKLEDAIAYANNNPSEELVIFMQNDYTLPAGYYTLPAKATLVVPMSDEQNKEINAFPPRVSYNDMDSSHPYEEPTEFRRLTFASGVNIDVHGKIEMTCSQFASNEAYTAQPYGPYGHLVMEEGSHMTLQGGSELRAWGYMTGKGETDARRNATVREMFQLGDWKGAMTSVKITGMGGSILGPSNDDSDKKIIPVSQYFIQNVESPVKYHPGAVLSTSAMVSEGLGGFLAVSMAATDIKIVGVDKIDQAIFLMDNGADADNTWVRKWYDAENDIQVYDINSAAHIGSMVLDMGELDASFLLGAGKIIPVRLNSAKFDLPITSNMKIHLLSGSMDFEQNTSLLPGSEVEIDKESIVSVSMNETEKNAQKAWIDDDKVGDEPVAYTGALYVYDAEDWDTYAFCRVVYENGDKEDSEAFTKVVRYAPSWNGRPTKRAENVCPPSAAINVHGMFNTNEGFVYTSEHGANIFSSNEDAGTYIFNQDAKDAGTRTVNNVKGESEYVPRTFYPAWLRNGDGTYKASYTDDGDDDNDAHEGDAYCYIDDEWKTMYPDEDNPCFMVKSNTTSGDKYFAKPAGYVEINATKEDGVFYGNADNTFSDAAGEGHLYILMDGCQWWEVEKKDNYYHCLHPNNDTYYEWNEDDEMWEEVTFTITWKNWNDTILPTTGRVGEAGYGLVKSYEVTYGTMAEYLGTNPTREKDADSTYNFTGWKPALGPVTQDVTYTATFQGQERKYTITFLNEGGTLIETQFLTHNAVPVCENTPTKVGHILQWSPAIGKVVADATYTATWLEEPPTKYEIRFMDYDGTVLASDSVEVGEVPNAPEFPQNKPATPENTYACSSWDAEVVAVTEAATYTAVYEPTAKTFTVKFITYNGDVDNENHYIIAPASYKYGETPVAPTQEQVMAAIERENTPNYTFNNDKYTYSFAWDPQIQTVMLAGKNYTATIDSVTNQYTIILKSNLSGVCTFTGAGTFDYGTEITNVAVSYNGDKYTFDGWSDLAAEDENKKNSTHPSFELTGDVTLTANFTPKALSDHTIAANETWDVEEDTEVKDLIITSDGSDCGQLLNPENLTIRGEAIFRMDQSYVAGQWYAVAVPWRVDPNTGIYGASSRLASGSQIYIIEFDGAAYANADIDGEGKTTDTYQYWHFLHQTGADMVPGKLYMIYLRADQSKLDFHKKSGAALLTRNLTVSAASGSAGSQFENWNAIANPALYTADLSTGVAAYQTYNGSTGAYVPVSSETENLIVGQPIFVQTATNGTVYATIHGGASPAPAYRRAPQTENDTKFVVEIARDGKMTDRLIVETADEKEDKYVIGQDLAKFGVSSKVAQMWINRYDAKLCANTVAWDGERAEYPLSIFAPAAGEYTITNNQSPITNNDEYNLYLTLNGEAIWNLSDGAYVVNLNKGTDANYGLRVSAKIPQVATGIDEAVVDSKDATATKVLINNQVFIIRGNEVYTVTGQKLQ